MRDTFKYIWRIGVLALVVILGACAVPYVPTPPVVKADRQELMEVFSAGYRNITEKYIEEVSAETVALGGLGGFSSIDPAVKVDNEAGQITLSYFGNSIKVIKAPATDNIIGWAALTSDMAVAAKEVSADMGEASKEKIFEAVFDGVLSGLVPDEEVLAYRILAAEPGLGNQTYLDANNESTEFS